jgi:hypothetical protein
MTEKVKSSAYSDKSENASHRVRLPGFITDEEVGLGDAIKRASILGCDRAEAANAERMRLTAGWFSRVGGRSRELPF